MPPWLRATCTHQCGPQVPSPGLSSLLVSTQMEDRIREGTLPEIKIQRRVGPRGQTTLSKGALKELLDLVSRPFRKVVGWRPSLPMRVPLTPEDGSGMLSIIIKRSGAHIPKVVARQCEPNQWYLTKGCASVRLEAVGEANARRGSQRYIRWLVRGEVQVVVSVRTRCRKPHANSLCEPARVISFHFRQESVQESHFVSPRILTSIQARPSYAELLPLCGQLAPFASSPLDEDS